jgi:hypothetical protein
MPEKEWLESPSPVVNPGFNYGGSGLTAAEVAAVRGCFKPAYLLGDSITNQHGNLGGGIHVAGIQGFWNWANWLVGAPFDFTNLGSGGATSAEIYSRIWQIPTDVNTAFCLTGTNDVNALSPTANAGAISALADSLIGPSGAIFLGLSRLKAAGKRIAIATIPPNNGWTAGDSRVTLLDQVNAWIRTTPTLGLADEVLDLFAVCWDETQPTARVFKSGYGNTNESPSTHLTSLAGLMGGIAFKNAMKRMYASATGRSTWIDTAVNTLAVVSAMRPVTGIASLISTGGTGTAATDMAGGWRTLRGAGTPTWTCSLENYLANEDFVGPMASMVGFNERWQRVLTNSSAAADNIRVMLNTTYPLTAGNNLGGIDKGDVLMAGCEVWVQNPTALARCELTFSAFFTSGTAPADRAYGSSTTTVRAHAGLATSNPQYPGLTQGFRAYMRTPQVRIPENVTDAAVSGQFFMDAIFAGADSTCDVRWARPALWRKVA